MQPTRTARQRQRGGRVEERTGNGTRARGARGQDMLLAAHGTVETTMAGGREREGESTEEGGETSLVG